MLVIHGQLGAETGLLAQTVFNRIDRSVAIAFDNLFFAMIGVCKNHLCIEFAMIVTDILNFCFAEMQRLFCVNVHIPEGIHNLFR